MFKTLNLHLKDYTPTPPSLADPTSSTGVRPSVDVELAKLFHHYYLDTRGVAPPPYDPAHFEHLSLLTPDAAFRVQGDGFGSGPEFRKRCSNELGQAFCRWLLQEHLGITHFAHMAHVLNGNSQRAFDGYTVEKIAAGDGPDYLCTDGADVFLAEAKGRIRAINFGSADFESWRGQFDRVAVRTSDGVARAVKGHIVATRFATEANSAQVQSAIYAEDPASPGDGPLREPKPLINAVKALHYVDIARKLRQPHLSRALLSGVPVPRDILFPALEWELTMAPLEGVRFVGGYIKHGDGVDPIALDENGQVELRYLNPFRLDVAGGTFIGLESGIFRDLCALARGRTDGGPALAPLPALPSIYSAISILRDGSVIGPVDRFRPVDQIVL